MAIYDHPKLTMFDHRQTCLTMVNFGYPSLNMVKHCLSMIKHGYTWSTIIIYALTCSPMVKNGLPWSTLVILSQPLSSMLKHGQTWPTIVNHVYPW